MVDKEDVVFPDCLNRAYCAMQIMGYEDVCVGLESVWVPGCTGTPLPCEALPLTLCELSGCTVE